MLISRPLAAGWDIISSSDSFSNNPTQIAYTENEQGYSLEIYRDGVGAIRSRFSLNRPLDQLAERHCPTFQIDTRLIGNRSINDAPCITDMDWSEFVLGYVNDEEVKSPKLYALVNGITITYRYMLDNGSYEETSFSLSGSKRATLTVIGGNINITP